MNSNIFNKVSNFNEYVSFTTNLKSHVNSDLICSNENLVNYFITMETFEVQYFKKYNECGAAFIILNTILQNQDFMVAYSDYLEDIVLILRYWLHTVRHDIIVNMLNKSWWTFLEEILGFIQRLCIGSQMRDILLKATSENLLELATCGLLDIYQINKVLKIVNKCLCGSKEIRLQLLDEYSEYFIKLSKYIAKCRHMDSQLTGLETLTRFLVYRDRLETRTRYANIWFTQPLYPKEVVRVFIETSWKNVFTAMRLFLMAYNHYYGHVISVLCKVTFGKITIDSCAIWVDFNTSLGSISISLGLENLREMGVVNPFMPEMLQISAQDAEKVESNEEAVVTIRTKAGPKSLYYSILEILDEDAKVVQFQLQNALELPLVDKCLRHIYNTKYHRSAQASCYDEGTRHTVSNSDDDSRHKLQERFVRRSGYASMSTKESKIPSSIALYKSKEAVKPKSSEINANTRSNKQLSTNNNNNLVDNITNNIFDFIELSSINRLKDRNISNVKLSNTESVSRDTNICKLPAQKKIPVPIETLGSKNTDNVKYIISKVKENNIVTVPESISRHSYGDSCAPVSYNKQSNNETTFNKIVIDKKIVENIINESLSRDTDSDTFTAPSNVNLNRKKGRKRVNESINNIVTNDNIIDNVILESKFKHVNSDKAEISDINLRNKDKIKNKPLNELIIDDIPETILNESLSRRADSDLVKEHFLNVDNDEDSDFEIINNNIKGNEGPNSDIEIINNDINGNIERNSNDGSEKQTIDAILNYLNPLDSGHEEASETYTPDLLLDEANNDNLIIDTTTERKKTVINTTTKPNAKKDRKKKTEKEKLPKTIEKTKPPVQRGRRKSTRITKNLELKTISKRKLYSVNQDLQEDQINVSICGKKSFHSGGSCYKDILRDREKHNARKSIKSKVLISPLSSPRTIKRNELFDQLRSSDEYAEKSKLTNRNIALYNFTSEEDDDDINLRSNLYEVQSSKSPIEPKDNKNKRKKKVNKSKIILSKKTLNKKTPNKKTSDKNNDKEMVVVNIIDSEDLNKFQDERIRDAPKEDDINTSIIEMPDEDYDDNIVLARLIPKHHMKPVIEIIDVENELNNWKINKERHESVKKTKMTNKALDMELEENTSVLNEIEENKESVQNNRKRKQKSNTGYKNEKYAKKVNENLKNKKTKGRNKKIKNDTQESVQSASPLPDLIIEQNNNKMNDKSDGSIERLNEIDKITLNEINNFDVEDNLETIEAIPEIETNEESHKEIMPPPPCSSDTAKKRYSLDTFQFKKRANRLSDFTHVFNEVNKVTDEEKDNCAGVLSNIIRDILQKGQRVKEVKEEINTSAMSDITKQVEPFIAEEIEKVNQRFQILCEKAQESIHSTKQMIYKTIDDRFKCMENEFNESLKREKEYVKNIIMFSELRKRNQNK